MLQTHASVAKDKRTPNECSDSMRDEDVRLRCQENSPLKRTSSENTQKQGQEKNENCIKASSTESDGKQKGINRSTPTTAKYVPKNAGTSHKKEVLKDDEVKEKLARLKTAQEKVAIVLKRISLRPCPFAIRKKLEGTPSPSDQLLHCGQNRARAVCRSVFSGASADPLPCSLAGELHSNLEPWHSCSQHLQASSSSSAETPAAKTSTSLPNSPTRSRTKMVLKKEKKCLEPKAAPRSSGDRHSRTTKPEECAPSKKVSTTTKAGGATEERSGMSRTLTSPPCATRKAARQQGTSSETGRARMLQQQVSPALTNRPACTLKVKNRQSSAPGARETPVCRPKKQQMSLSNVGSRRTAQNVSQSSNQTSSLTAVGNGKPKRVPQTSKRGTLSGNTPAVSGPIPPAACVGSGGAAIAVASGAKTLSGQVAARGRKTSDRAPSSRGSTPDQSAASCAKTLDQSAASCAKTLDQSAARCAKTLDQTAAASSGAGLSVQECEESEVSPSSSFISAPSGSDAGQPRVSSRNRPFSGSWLCSLIESPTAFRQKQEDTYGGMWEVTYEEVPGEHGKVEFRLRKRTSPRQTRKDSDSEREDRHKGCDHKHHDGDGPFPVSRLAGKDEYGKRKTFLTSTQQEQYLNVNQSRLLQGTDHPNYQYGSSSDSHRKKGSGGKKCHRKNALKGGNNANKSLSEIFRMLRAKGCLVNNCKTCGSQNRTDEKSPAPPKSAANPQRTAKGRNRRQRTAPRGSQPKAQSSSLSTTRAAGAVWGGKGGLSPQKKLQARLPRQIKSLNASPSTASSSCEPCGPRFETDPKRIQNEISLLLERTRGLSSNCSQPLHLPHPPAQLKEKRQENELPEVRNGPGRFGEYCRTVSKGVLDSAVSKDMLDSAVNKGVMDSAVSKGVLDSAVNKDVLDSAVNKGALDFAVVLDSAVNKGVLNSAVSTGVLDSAINKGVLDSAVSTGVLDSGVPIQERLFSRDEAERRRGTEGEGIARDPLDEGKTACDAEERRGPTVSEHDGKLLDEASINSTSPRKAPTSSPQLENTNANFSFKSPPSEISNDAPTPPNSPILRIKVPRRPAVTPRYPQTRRSHHYRQLGFLCKIPKVKDVPSSQRVCNVRERKSGAVPLRLAKIELQDGSSTSTEQSGESTWLRAATAILMRRAAVASSTAAAHTLQSKLEVNRRLRSTLGRLCGSDRTTSLSAFNGIVDAMFCSLTRTAGHGRVANDGGVSKSNPELLPGFTFSRRGASGEANPCSTAYFNTSAESVAHYPIFRYPSSSGGFVPSRDASTPDKDTVVRTRRISNRPGPSTGGLLRKSDRMDVEDDSDSRATLDRPPSGVNVSTNCATPCDEDFCQRDLEAGQERDEPVTDIVQQDVHDLGVEVTYRYDTLLLKMDTTIAQGHLENSRGNLLHLSSKNLYRVSSGRPDHEHSHHAQLNGWQSDEKTSYPPVTKTPTSRPGDLHDSGCQTSSQWKRKETYVSGVNRRDAACLETLGSSRCAASTRQEVSEETRTGEEPAEDLLADRADQVYTAGGEPGGGDPQHDCVNERPDLERDTRHDSRVRAEEKVDLYEGRRATSRQRLAKPVIGHGKIGRFHAPLRTQDGLDLVRIGKTSLSQRGSCTH